MVCSLVSWHLPHGGVLRTADAVTNVQADGVRQLGGRLSLRFMSKRLVTAVAISSVTCDEGPKTGAVVWGASQWSGSLQCCGRRRVQRVFDGSSKFVPFDEMQLLSWTTTFSTPMKLPQTLAGCRAVL